MKYEKVPYAQHSQRREFLALLRDMKPGQSFTWDLKQNDRLAVTDAQTLLNRIYRTAHEGEVHRIWRIR